MAMIVSDVVLLPASSGRRHHVYSLDGMSCDSLMRMRRESVLKRPEPVLRHFDTSFFLALEKKNQEKMPGARQWHFESERVRRAAIRRLDIRKK